MMQRLVQFCILAVMVGSTVNTASAGAPTPGIEAIASTAREAVQRIRPYVVQIQPIAAAAEKQIKSLGPTTGLYLPGRRCVVTSNYRISEAAGLIAFFDDGTRSTVTPLATDSARKLAVLRVAQPPATPREPPPVHVSTDALQVGQTMIAVGRVYRFDEPNLSVGILSAKRRLFGRAVQTDAAISPANYGGPLIDLYGRIVGVLTPLAPSSGAAPSDGAAWYDSGIGFAVPWPAVDKRLPRLLASENIAPGEIGIGFKSGIAYRTPPIVTRLHPEGPANSEGVQTGDQIIAVNNVPTPTNTALQFAMANADAGDSINLSIERDGERQTIAITLAAELPKIDQPAEADDPESGDPKEEGTDSNEIEETLSASDGNAAST